MTNKSIHANLNVWDKEKFSEIGQKLYAWLPHIKDLLIHAIGQIRVLRKAYPGVMHFLIFWGITIQILGTVINLMQMQLFFPGIELTFPRGNLYLFYEFSMDLAGLMILTGVGLAFYRRIALHPKTLETRWDDIYALVLLTFIPIAGFTLEGMRLLAASPEWAPWSFVGFQVARFWRFIGIEPELAARIHPYLFWTHLSLGLVLAASIPFTKLRHLVAIPLNILIRPDRKTGALEKIENIDEAEILGVGKINEFTSQQLLSFDACVRCGRCEEVCPAAISGMNYSPRAFIQSLRQAMVQELVSPNGNGSKSATETTILGNTIAENTPWFCTTCGACVERCPAFVRPLDEIIDLRRFQALTTGKVPKPIADTLRNLERYGNPWGIAAPERTAWAANQDIREIAPGEKTDVLLFLGCAFAFDDRNKRVAQAFINLLKKLNVDFAILGLDETCCGETARRMGNEYLFQVLAEQNIAALQQVKFNRLVTQCPHCFNTIKNEYPQLGGVFPVQHYTEYLASLAMPELKIPHNGNAGSELIAYHDSCYLGRYNQLYQAPRQLLDHANNARIELKRSKQNSFCCGGGGGQMWLETEADTRINHHRLADVQNSGAKTVATACPYCLLMFDDAIRSKGLGDQIQVLDIAEILDQRLNG